MELEPGGRGRHPGIVGHDGGQLVAEELRGGEMDGVEAAQDPAIEGRGRLEQRIVDTDQMETRQETAGSRDWSRTVWADSSEHLDPREGARSAVALSTQISPERRGLGLRDHQLHERR